MKRIGFVFLLLIVQLSAYTQDYHVVDSIKRLLQNEQVQDSNTVKSYLRLAGEYMWSVPDTSIYYANKALSLSRQRHFTIGEFFALTGRAYPLAVVREDSAAVSSAYQAIAMAEALHKNQFIADAYFTLGAVYIHLKEFDKGILYHRKGLSYWGADNPYALLNYDEHLAQCFIGLNRTDSAFYYANKALADDKQLQYNNGFDLYLMGNVFLQKELPDSALKYYTAGLAMVTAQRVLKDMADCNLGIANAFLQKNRFDSAIHYAKNGWIVASKTRLPNEKLDALNLLTSLFASQKKVDSAYKYQQYATVLKDSIYNAAKVRQIQLLAFNDDLRKLQDAEVARKRLNANIIIALVALLLFAFVIVAIIYRNNRHRKKAYALLQQQKEEIDNKNRELEIESALEKVRSRSLAMRQSDELKEVVKVVFEKLQDLGISFDFASIDLYREGSKDFDSYVYGRLGNEFVINERHNPYFNHPSVNDMIKGRESGADFQMKTYTKEEIESVLIYMLEQTELKLLPESQKAQLHSKEGYTAARAFGKNCAVVINNLSAKQFTEGEQKILSRFAKVFEQAYTRFLDLQKAEAQTREAQIEASLERVRSRSLAMHQSNELQYVVGVMYEQLTKLGFNKNEDVVSINLFDDDTGNMLSWAAGTDGAVPFCLTTPKNGYAIYTNIWKAKANGEDFLSKVYLREEKNAFWSYLFAQNNYAQLPQDHKDSVMQGEGYAYDIAIAQHACIMYLNFHGRLTLNDEQKEILKRFVNVFEQAYIRFLDLQKAEALAREAQIEAALERVRSRSMGMQKSEELREVIQLVLDQLLKLHFPIDSASFTVDFNESNEFRVWLAAPGQQYAARIDVPYLDHPIFNRTLEAKEKGETFYTLQLTKEEKNRFFDHFFKYAPVTEERRKMLYSSAGYALSAVLMKSVMLTIYNYSAVPYSAEQNATLARFGTAFEQTYTRFLDLQKVEAQAREAQIEAALERVRSRSMGMQKSKELREVIQLILDQLLTLHFSIDSASFVVELNEGNDFKTWLAAPGQQYAARIDIPYIDHPIFRRYLEAKEKGDIFYTVLLKKEEKDRFFNHFLKYAPVAAERSKMFYSSAGWAQSTVLMKTVALNIQNYSAIPYSEEQNKTLVRFGKAFEQTYTRFLDLQKAEAQAKEAQIEAALERVRSRSMGMQKSEELREVIQVIFDQLYSLHINLDFASFAVEIDKTNDLRNWVASPLSQYATRIDVPYIDHPVFNRVIEAKEKGEDFITMQLNKEEKNRFFDHFYKFAATTEERKRYVFKSESWVQSIVVMRNVMLTMANYSSTPFSDEENKILMRFGKAFEQTYTRFLDLQKAEAAAKEAVKQASIDRVRAEIASMRTTKDLDRIIPLIWNELTLLHIPFIRCGVFIVNEDAQQTQVYLSTPEGKAIAAFQLPFNSEGLNKNMLEHWRNNQIFKDYWDAATFTAWTHSLLESGAIQPDERYSNEKPPENLYLHFVPFMQGMLYVGNTASLSADELSLIESLADAFATAYARYEDFSKLEMAKQQIETTLTELKSMQAQLIQSEKMASLGELTAGIAHEIQNPLNFVNNFSEINTELIEELKNEKSKLKSEEFDELLNDIAENEQKINQHGKRADAIVKGMLQHSRANGGKKEPTDINALADEYLRLSFHGLRAKDKSFNADFKTDFDKSVGKIELVPQDIGRVLLNLFNNAFYAVNEKKKASTIKGENYEPTVWVTTKRISSPSGPGGLEISVKDNGNGIPQKVVDKIFQPFFTTKPTGQGTGLGLSLSYDIVKAHGGEIKVESKEDDGTAFLIQLPTNHLK